MVTQIFKRRLHLWPTLGATILCLFTALPIWAEPENFLLRVDGRVRGDQQAPLTLLEYSDFTCGFCVKFFKETWPRLNSEYIQTGKLRLVYRDFSRTLKGPGVDMALAARCAGEQGQYWAMHDRLFSSKDKYGAGPLEHQAADLGLDREAFSTCFQSGRYLESIFQDFQEGGSIGIRGTPGFVLFLTQHIDAGPLLVIPGAFPYEVFKEEIDRLLKKFSEKKSPQHQKPGIELPLEG